MKQIPFATYALAVASAFLVSFPSDGVAAGGDLDTLVSRVLISDDARWGGCMAQLSSNPQDVLPNCSPWYVTFSCSGDFTDRVRAYRMLDQAQLALVTGKRLRVWFQDDKTHNGYCFANRVDLLQ